MVFGVGSRDYSAKSAESEGPHYRHEVPLYSGPWGRGILIFSPSIIRFALDVIGLRWQIV